MPDLIEFIVSHDDLAPVDEGSILPIVTPAFARRENFVWFRRIVEVVFLGWGQK
jgi:hypothetical protein